MCMLFMLAVSGAVLLSAVEYSKVVGMFIRMNVNKGFLQMSFQIGITLCTVNFYIFACLISSFSSFLSPLAIRYGHANA